MKFFIYQKGKKVSDRSLLKKFSTESIGVFESLRAYNGCFFRLKEHLTRLEDSCRSVGYSHKVFIPQIKSDLEKAISVYCQETLKGASASDIFVRITLWQGEIFIMLGQKRHAPELYQTGIKLRTSPVRRGLENASPCGVKTNAYQNAILASLEPSTSEIYEWVFLDNNGFVTEVRIGNLLMVKKKTLWTPPAPGILNGVTRNFVIECAPKAGIPVREVHLTRHDLFNAEEIFLTNTSWEMLPVRELDSRRIGIQVPGPLTLKLQQIFNQRVRQECLPLKSNAH